jgi:thymidine phosphorylase
VQAAAGVLLLVDPGDVVEAGQPLLELHTDTPDALPGARAALVAGVTITDTAPPRPPLLLDTIRG